jgi:hypothetical protein
MMPSRWNARVMPEREEFCGMPQSSCAAQLARMRRQLIFRRGLALTNGLRLRSTYCCDMPIAALQKLQDR